MPLIFGGAKAMPELTWAIGPPYTLNGPYMEQINLVEKKKENAKPRASASATAI